MPACRLNILAALHSPVVETSAEISLQSFLLAHSDDAGLAHLAKTYQDRPTPLGTNRVSIAACALRNRQHLPWMASIESAAASVCCWFLADVVRTHLARRAPMRFVTWKPAVAWVGRKAAYQ